MSKDELGTMKLSKPVNLAIVVLRLMLSAWIGAAILFVITSVAEQTSEHFGSLIRDQLAAIRFPHYYFFGCCIHVSCLVLSAFVAMVSANAVRRRFLYVGVFVLLSAMGMIADYQLVYQPLLELITPPGQVRTPEFTRLHNLSRYANQVHLSLMFVAAVIASRSLPDKMPSSE